MGRGGKRPGAGRPTKPVTEARRDVKAMAIRDAMPDAEYALGLNIAVMRDESADLKLRIGCSVEVLDRVIGKAKQQVDVNTTGHVQLEHSISADAAGSIFDILAATGCLESLAGDAAADAVHPADADAEADGVPAVAAS